MNTEPVGMRCCRKLCVSSLFGTGCYRNSPRNIDRTYLAIYVSKANYLTYVFFISYQIVHKR